MIAYLPVIVKVYTQLHAVQFMYLQPLIYGPFLFCYSYQIIKEVVLTDFKPKVLEQKARKTHLWNVIKLNVSLLPNWFLVTAFCITFSNLLCARLDSVIELSYFVVLIPFWLLLLYVCSYVILVGLASTNSKVNKAERLILSLFVPLGFLCSTVLAVCYVDGYIKNVRLGYLFLPQLASFLGAYLYGRCLVKHSSRRIQNDPVDSAR